jgi:hypothetical protein
MYSGMHKNTFMDFNTYKTIVDNCKDDFELQLEGGEPLLNRLLYLFMWYAYSTDRCKKIIITTNGKLLKKHLNNLTTFCGDSNIPLQIKMSINYYLLNENKNIMKFARDTYLATEFIEKFEIRFNVRLRHSDDWLIKELKNNKIYEQSNIYYLQSYGKLKGSEYDEPIIMQNIDNWFLYSCDGKCFNQDLVARSEYEKGVN